RTVLNGVHEIFPQPITYIDCCSMLGEFHQAGFFMTYWGMRRYKEVGRPALADSIAARHPAFVIVNSRLLRAAMIPGSPDVPSAYSLLDADAEALRDNYIPHWGMIWVAGKTVAGVNV